MRGLFRGLFGVLLAAVGLLGTAGCSSEGTPNTSLTVPDVPPGGHGTKDPALKKPRGVK